MIKVVPIFGRCVFLRLLLCFSPELERESALVYLEQQGYPAPQVIRTRTGNLLAELDGWCSLITTFIEGTVLQPTLEQLHLLGAALGHLHTVSPNRVAPGFPPIGKSNWYPEHALSSGLVHLASIEHLLPEEWLQYHAAFRQTFQPIGACPDLPTTIIHADGWGSQCRPDESQPGGPHRLGQWRIRTRHS